MSEEQYNPVVESAAIDADELMAKYDKESAYRRLTGFPSKLVFFLCVAWSVSSFIRVCSEPSPRRSSEHRTWRLR